MHHGHTHARSYVHRLAAIVVLYVRMHPVVPIATQESQLYSAVTSVQSHVMQLYTPYDITHAVAIS